MKTEAVVGKVKDLSERTYRSALRAPRWLAWRNHFSPFGLALGVLGFFGGAPVLTGLPPASSIKLPRPCPGPTTYYVIAENPDGRTVEDASR